MKRRKKRPSQVVGRQLAQLEVMGVVLAVAEDDGWLNLVRVNPDGSAESVAELDTPGMSPDQCFCMLREALYVAYDLVKEQELLNRFRRNMTTPAHDAADDPDLPLTGLGPYETN